MRTVNALALALVLLAGCTQGTVVLHDEDAETPADTDTLDTDTLDTDTLDTGDTGDTDDDGDTGDTGETGTPAACPSFAPFDRDGAWWTYDVGGYPMTFAATGEQEWHGLRVFGQIMSMPEYGVEVIAWYTCEADGLHQAGTEVEMSGTRMTYFYDPQPLMMPMHPVAGATWSVDYSIYEESGAIGNHATARAAAYASEGTPDTFQATITGIETVEVAGGTFETWALDFAQQGYTDKLWWAEGVGYVRQGIAPENMDLVEYGPM